MLNSILDAALGYTRAGLSVLPIKVDGSKSPDLPTWRDYQQTAAGEDLVARWFLIAHGIGLACGRASGGLELLDFDDDEAGADWLGMMADHEPALRSRLVVVKSPRGWHVWYRVVGMDVPGNLDLAWRPLTETERQGYLVRNERVPTKKTLIQTRGQGGQGLVPGGAVAAHPSRQPYVLQSGPTFAALARLTVAERATMHSLARMLDRLPPTPPAAPPRPLPPDHEDLPGTDFDRRGSWPEILEPHGWVCLFTRGEVSYWRRPGKSGGHSATVGFCKDAEGNPLLRVFSSNAAPLEEGHTYGRFRALVLLDYHGDHGAAASALRLRGFGRPVPVRPQASNANPATALPGATPTPVAISPDGVPLPRFPRLDLIPGPDHDEADEGLTMTELMDLDLPEPSWLATDVIPDEGLTILSGPKKSRKSWLLLDLADAVLAGRLWLGKQCKRGPVLHYVLEDGQRTTRDRLTLMQATPQFRGNVPWRMYESLNLSADAHLEALCRRIERYAPAAVIIDNLTQAKGARIKENDNDTMGFVLGQVHRIAVFYKVAIVLAHHAGRPKEGQTADPGFLHRGASAISGCSAANLSIVNKSYLCAEGRTLRASFRWSMVFDGISAYRWRRTFTDDAEGDDACDDLRPYATHLGQAQADERQLAEQWLQETLAREPATLTNLVQAGNAACGFDRTREWWRQRLHTIRAVAPGNNPDQRWHPPTANNNGDVPGGFGVVGGWGGDRDEANDEDTTTPFDR